MTWFNKYYRCSNDHEWQDEWNCLCNDRCPECNQETEPYDHVEIDETPEEKAFHDALVHGQGTTLVSHQDGVLKIEHIPFIMLIPRGDYNATSDCDILDGIDDLRNLHTGSESINPGTADD